MSEPVVPDFYSFQSTPDLQKTLREAVTQPAENLINRGAVSIDFAQRRIFRDSYWKGGFAKDSLLGWEERVRTAVLGGDPVHLHTMFASGSFWKRFDFVENGVVRGHVVNYQLESIPGDPEARLMEYPDDKRRYFAKGDKMILLVYRNHPYRIGYDTIKIVDDQNSIGVMHLGKFPDGVELATFVMTRNNYPFEKMALVDHQALFNDERVRKPAAAELTGPWTGTLVFLEQPNLSIANQANPALLEVTFAPSADGVTAKYRLGHHDFMPESTVQRSAAELQEELRLLDPKTLIGRWTVRDMAPKLADLLGGFLKSGGTEREFSFVLTRSA